MAKSRSAELLGRSQPLQVKFSRSTGEKQLQCYTEVPQEWEEP
ncbi:MAG: hypothetical protein ACKPEN_09480 [Planktothrix sp.]